MSNLVELVNLTTRQGNISLEEHIETCSSRESLLNILLDCCSDAIKGTMIKRVDDTQYFSILCDEASDTSKASFCLRCVDKKGEICEEFLKFVHCKSGWSGKDLFKKVVDNLNELEFDPKNYWAQW